MIVDITAIITTVATDVEALEYTSITPMDEITAYPALILEDRRRSFKKIAANGQIYHVKYELKFNLFATQSTTAANFDALYDLVIQSLAGKSGYETIVVKDDFYAIAQIGASYCHGYEFTVEFLKKDNWV